MAAPATSIEREWVSVRDRDRPSVLYTFDVSFLLSGWTCIYGQGCQGIGEGTTDADVGCCSHGAYLNEDDDPDELVRLVAEELDDSLMQHHALAADVGCTQVDDEGEVHTRLVDGACIFLNRSGHPSGSGCALHALAMERREHHMTHKPQVCWQLPLHRTIDERTGNDGEPMQVHTIAAYERGHWGSGGADFGWYCTEEPAAFEGSRPVFRDMEYELREMVGDAVYEDLVTYLDSRRRQRNTVRFLPLV